MSERTAAWAVTATTADLLWHYHMTIAEMPELVRVRDDPAECDDARIAADRLIAERVISITAIVAELRRRGHSVAWEE